MLTTEKESSCATPTEVRSANPYTHASGHSASRACWPLHMPVMSPSLLAWRKTSTGPNGSIARAQERVLDVLRDVMTSLRTCRSSPATGRLGALA
jgi:hypothetical protein